ncbi:hypothetical protein [Aneurinibacillus migulanus]|uniref:hypothetical protein n=1 Tax=Aneurinibacillus migulanus TaxID=47500 RepID=UPI000AE42B19|nr:hypothetical protein [Aneurinibacillus migulanus]MCP1358823.1 hypothetical protein [Aneurinibacillus migulanus]
MMLFIIHHLSPLRVLDRKTIEKALQHFGTTVNGKNRRRVRLAYCLRYCTTKSGNIIY